MITAISVATSLACAVALCPSPVHAQVPPPGLRARMDAFARALREQEPMEKIASFFPRHADWELVQAPDRAAPGARVGRWRFAAGQTLRAISEGGPVCDSFGGVTGDVGPEEGALVMQVMDSDERPWRYVGRNRFVPTGKPASSPVFAEWAREDGAWVVSRLGEVYWYFPHLAGVGLHEPMRVSRDTLRGRELPASRRFGSSAPGFDRTAPLLYRMGYYVPYGLPRSLPEELLARFGTVAAVPVFIEGGASRDVPEVLYLPFAPGQWQPYNAFGHSICRD